MDGVNQRVEGQKVLGNKLKKEAGSNNRRMRES